MKFLLLLTAILFYLNSDAQKAKVDLAKVTVSADRKALIDALKPALEKDLRLKPKLVVTHLWTKGGFAFFRGNVKDGKGKDIDFSKTVYRDELKGGMFDGDATFALLKKTNGKWKVLAFVIGPTDVAYACWWKEYKAPKDIFDYTENCK